MPDDFHIHCIHQIEVLVVALWYSKVPVPSPVMVVVFVFDPLCSFERVSSHCPSPRRLPEPVLNTLEGLARAGVPVIVGPPDYDRVDFSYQGDLSGSCQFVDLRFDFPLEARYAPMGRPYQQLPFVFAYVLTEKVKALIDMSDFGLLFGENQTPLR